MEGEHDSKSSHVFKQSLHNTERYKLKLYVTGTTPRSVQAILNIRQVCEVHLHGRYELEVIDLYQQPELAEEAQLLAAPTLIKQLPPPLRKLVGTLSDEDRVLAGLDLLPRIPGALK